MNVVSPTYGVDVREGTPVAVTLTTQMSYVRPFFSHCSFNRFDRLPFLLKRWKGPISIGTFVKKEEYPDFSDYIADYMGLPITFSVYVPLGLENSSYYIRRDGSRELFPKTLYPMNLLRDLAIESIKTSHYMYIDADFFISSGNEAICSS